MSAFDRLIEQIDAFIRKYYKNEMVKGLLLFFAFLIASFLMVTSLEYFGRFNNYVRAFLFSSFILVNAYIFGRYLFRPIMRLFSFGRKINRFQAAGIIGNFFPQISDRLVNTLQLQDNAQDANYELIRASVVQKSKSLTAFSFGDAIDLSENRKYLKFVLPLFFLLLTISIVAPGLITQGTERVVRFDKDFIPPAPFSFNMVNTEKEVNEGDEFKVMVELKGSAFPEKIYLIANGGTYLMSWEGKNKAVFLFPKVSENLNLKFVGGEFFSEEFVVNVIPKSVVGKLEAKLLYPSYLGRKQELVQNATDLTIPEGTEIVYSCLVKNVNETTIKGKFFSKKFDVEGFNFGKKFTESESWVIRMKNDRSNVVDSISLNFNVVKDQYPSIVVNELKDSLMSNVRYFSGNLNDDYGLSNLQFVYKISSDDGKVREERMRVIQPRGLSQRFDYAVDFGREKLTLNDRIEYWFVVTDNDGVNGGKSSRSETFVYKLPKLEELNEKRDEDQKSINKSLTDVVKKAEEFKKDINRLNKELNDSKSSSWKNKNEMQRLSEEQMSLQKQLESLQKKMDQSIQEKNQLSEVDPDLLEKQKMIEDLMKDLMDQEMIDLLKKLEDLMEKGNKEEMLKNMDKLSESAEDQKKSLDRSLEMLKKLQVNEKIDDVEKELEKLSKEQDDLKKETGDKQNPSEELKKKQDELNKKFEDILKELDTIQKLNKDLERPMDIGDQKELKDKIQNEMDGASQNLDKNKKSKAQEDQKNSSDDLKKMSEELNKMQEEANQQQESEDIESLKRILKNLMMLSFDQESTMKSFSKVNDADPRYRALGRKQRAIIDDTKIVRDSLEALARRQPKIASFVDKELNDISANHKLSVDHIDEHQRRELNANQQLVMTSYNNLALLLNEALEAMQQEMNSKPGNGSCDKPGGKGRPKPGQGMGNMDMKQMLKQQLEQMEKGLNPGGKKPGGKEGQGQQPGGMSPGGQGMGMPGLMSKEIAKMVGEQTMIRQRLEQLRNELNKDGQGRGNQLNPLLKEIEEQERALLNRNFNAQLISRQKEILTRLLESEKALMERGFEEKRESSEGKDRSYGNKIQFDEYNKEKLRQVELLRSVDPTLKKYYKDKANSYFNSAL
ncbi:MAG: hypothetical protein KJ941_10400 [Bacteroidetes bacterium]|nr:hypothetical protein [Bacteroidota bacterium]